MVIVYILGIVNASESESLPGLFPLEAVVSGSDSSGSYISKLCSLDVGIACAVPFREWAAFPPSLGQLAPFPESAFPTESARGLTPGRPLSTIILVELPQNGSSVSGSPRYSRISFLD